MRQSLLGLIMLLFFGACVPLIDEENNKPIDTGNTNGGTTGSNTGTGTNTGTPTVWQSLTAVSAQTLIKSIYSTSNEMYFISDNQFIRLDTNSKVIEDRQLPADRPLFGSPVMSQNAFMRISQGLDNKQVIEFHHAKNRNAIIKIVTSSLVEASLKESFQIDVFARTPGCFSTDGTKYFLPGVVYDSYKATLMILDIKYTPDGNNFQSISLLKRIEITGLATDGKIESCRYLNGNFYLATKDGGFRITSNGEVKKLFNHWTHDFFEKDGKIYSSGFASTDFFKSTDNGITWSRYGNGNFKFVECIGNKIFTQTQKGLRYSLLDNTLLKAVEMKYNTDFTTDPDSYYGIGFSKNLYYINVGSKIYTIKEPIAK